MAWQEREHDVTTSKRVRKRRKRQKQDNRHNKNNSLDLKYEMKGHLFFGHFHLLLLQSYHPSGNLHASGLSHAKTILQGILEGGRRRGRQKKCWMDNIKERTSMPMPELLSRASCRKDWNGIFPFTDCWCLCVADLSVRARVTANRRDLSKRKGYVINN